MRLTQEQMEKAARGSSFMQDFKMEWWKQRENNIELPHIPEKHLDELAMIAFDLLDK